MAYSSNDAAAFFDSFATAFDTMYDAKRGPLMRWIDRRFRSDMFERFARTFASMPEIEGLRVLDIGCGSGPYLLEALRRRAESVTGVDPAPAMLDLAAQRLKDAGYSEQAKLVEATFPGVKLNAHDYVIVMGVLDYVEDAQEFITALRPLTARACFISFPSKHWFRTPIRKVRYRLRKCPVYFYDEPGIRAIASRAGFSQVDIHKIPGAGMDFHVCLKP